MGFEEAILRHAKRGPIAMHDEIVNIVTTSKALEELTVRMYRNREKSNNINPPSAARRFVGEKLLLEAQANVEPEWTKADIKGVLGQLKIFKI